jgi:GT2 family glycosyltransferase
MTLSVVMPVHGNWPVVSQALQALRQDGVVRDVIVVDDASPDETRLRLRSEFDEVLLIEKSECRGFNAASNEGAKRAGGRFICFLNSDTRVKNGALAALERAADQTGVGAAAPLLLNADGSLQEAGGAVGRDGVTFPLGRGARPDDPTWAFTREIDYGSAACLVVRRSTFEELGGFDPAFAPAYYEDADLCLRMADRGLRTMLEPAARVTHLQYGSGSRERAQALVTRNRRTFLERWGRRLAERPIVSSPYLWAHRLIALRDAISLVRFLVFEDDALASSLANRWPRARVTLLGGSGADDRLEHAHPPDLGTWLERRRFHYWVVFGSPTGADEALSRSQPQAARLDARSDDLEEALVAVGVPPPAEEPVG